jgi:hypothetical protein
MDKLPFTYRRWLEERLSVEANETEAVLTTPFLDSFNDYIQVYGDRMSGGAWRLTDDGETLFTLQANGVGLSTRKRKELFRKSVNRFGVSYIDPELFVEAPTGDLPGKLHSLVQAIIAVGDLLYTAQPHVKSIFKQEVEDWFGELDVRVSRNAGFEGESGLTHKFDFVIPGQPAAGIQEKIVDAVSSVTKQNIEKVMLSWRDVEPTRDAEMYAILDDTQKTLPADKTEALVRYDVTPLRWSQRDDYAARLAE